MIQAQALGALANSHALLLQLVENLPARDCNRCFDPQLPSAGWVLGRSVFLELHLLRSLVRQDDDLAGRVRHFFDTAPLPDPAIHGQLPPHDHLLNWATQVFDEHLTWLANPGQLPPHALLRDSWLVWHLAQRHALNYETLLAVLTARTLHRWRGDYRVRDVLQARLPRDDSVRIEQGHYRIGARDGAVLANEQPAQTVELNAFRISRRPVSNAEYLAFIEDQGYATADWWDEAGARWLNTARARRPWHWRQNDDGHWYDVSVNGAADLGADEAVAGLCAHEARAFAAWASARGHGLSGAVPQHEYQWEVAARLGHIEQTGRSWEWCANGFHTYPAYQRPLDPLLETCGADDDGRLTLRGGCLHTQPVLRRTTLRQCGEAAQRTLFAGTRLVMPPGKAAWE